MSGGPGTGRQCPDHDAEAALTQVAVEELVGAPPPRSTNRCVTSPEWGSGAPRRPVSLDRRHERRRAGGAISRTEPERLAPLDDHLHRDRGGTRAPLLVQGSLWPVSDGPVDLRLLPRKGDGCQVRETWTEMRPHWIVALDSKVMAIDDRATHNRSGMASTLAALRQHPPWIVHVRDPRLPRSAVGNGRPAFGRPIPRGDRL